MYPTSYVPFAEHLDIELIRMSDLGHSEKITSPSQFMSHFQPILDALADRGMRHGDLTEYSMIIKDNKPYLIDWGESRPACDPRPDKRPEGDKYWLLKTMKKLCNP